MTGGKRKLEWRRARKYIRFFLILFIPRVSNCKNLFADSRFYYTTFLKNLHHFPYFDPTKKSAIIFFYNFQRHSYNICASSVTAHAHNAIFVILVWALLARIVDEIENSKSKSFYNYLTHHLPAITEFSFFWDTLLYNVHIFDSIWQN